MNATFSKGYFCRAARVQKVLRARPALSASCVQGQPELVPKQPLGVPPRSPQKPWTHPFPPRFRLFLFGQSASLAFPPFPNMIFIKGHGQLGRYVVIVHGKIVSFDTLLFKKNLFVERFLPSLTRSFWRQWLGVCESSGQWQAGG